MRSGLLTSEAPTCALNVLNASVRSSPGLTDCSTVATLVPSEAEEHARRPSKGSITTDGVLMNDNPKGALILSSFDGTRRQRPTSISKSPLSGGTQVDAEAPRSVSKSCRTDLAVARLAPL